MQYLVEVVEYYYSCDVVLEGVESFNLASIIPNVMPFCVCSKAEGKPEGKPDKIDKINSHSGYSVRA